MTLNDLRNPRNIECLFHLKRQIWIEKTETQGWQEWPGSVELWEETAEGLRRVKRWLKTSVFVFTTADKERKEGK